jgi:hypothetical protein
VREGRYESGRGLILEALGAAWPSDRILGHLWLSQTALALDDPAEAERIVLEGLGLRGSDAEKIPLRRLLGIIREARRPGSGLAEIDAALSTARASGRRLEEARTSWCLAGYPGATDPDVAREEALRVATELTGSLDSARRALAP